MSERDSRLQLARTGQQQLQQLIGTLQQLLQAHSSAAGPGSEEFIAARAALEQQYRDVSQSLQQTLAQCQQLEQRAATTPEPHPQDQQQLQQQVDDLQQQVAARVALLKAATDQLRSMTDNFQMWDNQQQELATREAA